MFSAQSVRENEKFVCDDHTLNSLNVEEAFAVKTDMKSVMNWCYIFFKFEEDAKAYLSENDSVAMVTIDELPIQTIERHQKNMVKDGEAHNHNRSYES